jgi:lysine-specific demethylase 3
MFQDLSKERSKVDKVLHFHYLICMLLPILKQINQDQSIEIEIEAKIKGSHRS